MAGGLVITGAAVHDYATRYSNDSIWTRQKAQIERLYHPGQTRFGRLSPQQAEELKTLRLEELRAGISRLEGASREERCVFDKHFHARLGAKTEQEAAALVANESYEPYGECKSSEQLKDTATKWYTLAGLAAILVGAFSLIASFVGGRQSSLAPELQKKRKKMEKESRESLTNFGFSKKSVEDIVSGALAAQTVNDMIYYTHTTANVLRTLENYGFSKAEIENILLTHPLILSVQPILIGSRLHDLENGDKKKTVAEVKAEVLRMPAVLAPLL